MQAVILAGGKGTRLSEIAKDIPKPMVSIAGKPILEHQVELLRSHGIVDILMITGHLSRVIEEYFGDGSRFGVRVRYYVEEIPLGTTGGIKMAESMLMDEFLVLYGDVMLDVDLGRMIEFHRRKGSRCTLALHPNDHPYDSDLVEIDQQGRVTAFHPKPHPQNFYYHNIVNAALYLLTRDVLAYIPTGVKADFGKDLFPKILSNLPLYGYVTPEYMKDVGTPERIVAVEQDLMEGKFARRSLRNQRPAVFLDRDGVLNKEVHLLARAEQLELLPGVAEAVRMLNKSDYLGIVVTNQPVVARNLCTLDELDAIHKKLETRLGEQHAWLDAIEFCPHHPDSGYPGENPEFKIECDCRKPKTGMIDRSRERFNIDTARSWLIGDSARDIECGQRAGLQTIGVRTGYGCQDAPCHPDYIFDDLYDAVDFIVNDPYASTCQKILDKLTELNRSGVRLILVAGLSRSGKTVFTRRLAREMRLCGMRPLVVQLDAWLVPVGQRNPGDDVFTRFRTDVAARDINVLLQGKKVTIYPYDARTRGLAPEPLKMSLDTANIVLIEGVTALHSQELLQQAELKIVVEAPETLTRQRFGRFYSWKGLDQAGIEELYNGRYLAEAASVGNEYAKADFRVRLCAEENNG